MAGAGYKLFNTGDVLTAAQVNTYLMQQTVMVFASSAARTSALSGVLAEGMVSYLQDTNTLEVYDGSAWVGATGDITGLTAGTGISISSATGPVPTITSDVATTFDAKGDLVVGTGADTFSKLTAGQNGESIVADDSASTGLRWQGSYAGGKNFLINGGFDIWQRSTSNGTAGYQSADRWYQNATQSTTFARESTTVPVSSTYSLKMTANVGSQQMWIQQPIESLSAIRLAGKTIAVAADVSASTSTGMTINVYSSTTVDNTAAGSWGSAITPSSGGSGTAVSGSFTRISGTYAIPSTAKSVMVQIITTGNVANGVIVYIGNVQAEIGFVPTAFTLAGGTLAGELAACQRYYEKSYDIATAPAAITTNNNIAWNAVSTAADRNYVTVLFKTTKRGTPTITLYSPITGTSAKIYNALTTPGDKNASTNYIQDASFAAYVGPTQGANAVGDLLLVHYVASAEL